MKKHRIMQNLIFRVVSIRALITLIQIVDQIIRLFTPTLTYQTLYRKILKILFYVLFNIVYLVCIDL